MPSLPRSYADERGAALPDGAGYLDCAHRHMSVMGYVSATQRARSDCDQPLRAVCDSCGYVEQRRCGTYRCDPCGETKRRRVQRVIEDGVAVQIANGLYGHFVTLTAPGVNEHRRNYPEGAMVPAVRAWCDCHRHGLTDGEWNAQESACWNRLRTALARDSVVAFAGSVETQKRGLLHRHLVIFTDRPMLPLEVHDLAQRAGYGCRIDVQRLESARKAARYLSKYVTKGAKQRPDVPWKRESLDMSTGELTESLMATFRLWSSSRAWGATVKALRAAQAAQARARGAARDWQAALSVIAAVGLDFEELSSPDSPDPCPP